MNTEQARDAMVAAVAAAVAANYPTMKVFYENADTVPIDTVGDFFMRVAVDFNGARQATVEASPRTRVVGELCLTHMAKDGSGTKTLLARADTLNAALQHVNLSGVQLATPYPGRKESHSGWFSQEWCIPFWYHQ